MTNSTLRNQEAAAVCRESSRRCGRIGGRRCLVMGELDNPGGPSRAPGGRILEPQLSQRSRRQCRNDETTRLVAALEVVEVSKGRPVPVGGPPTEEEHPLSFGVHKRAVQPRVKTVQLHPTNHYMSFKVWKSNEAASSCPSNTGIRWKQTS